MFYNSESVDPIVGNVSWAQNQLNSKSISLIQETFPRRETLLAVPDLISIQHESFKRFLRVDLKKALKRRNPINVVKHGFKIQFFPELIQFKKPEWTPAQATLLGKTYGSSVYIPVLVKYKEWEQPKLEWILLGSLPLLTKNGHFIINGISRVVLHQISRNPGVYLMGQDYRTRYPSVRIVPQRGNWISLTTDRWQQFWIRTKSLSKKVPLLIFLQCLGFSREEILTQLQNSPIQDSPILGKLEVKNFEPDPETAERSNHDEILAKAGLSEHPETSLAAMRYLMAYLSHDKTTDEKTPDPRLWPLNNELDPPVHSPEPQEFYLTSFWNPKTRFLGFYGRKQFRDKLHSLEISPYITKNDILLATQALIQLVLDLVTPDDIDNLNNKRIRGCEEFLSSSLTRAVRDFEFFVNRKFHPFTPGGMETFWRRNKSTLAKYVSKGWKVFFTGGNLAQYMDETNPLAELTHKRRLTVIGPGGVSGKHTSIKIRGIHPSYYGRLCPIETPEGKNAGLVNSFATYARLTSRKNIETPYYKVYKGQVQAHGYPHYVSEYDEKALNLAPADLPQSFWNTFPKTQLPVRKNWNVEAVSREQITAQSIRPGQMISVATSLIPFLEHDDANRALMGSNMQRQAVTLLKPEVAFVQTGMEGRVVADIGHGIKTIETSYITGLSSCNIKTYVPKHSTFLESSLRLYTQKSETKTNSLISRKDLQILNTTKSGFQRNQRSTFNEVLQSNAFNVLSRRFSNLPKKPQIDGNLNNSFFSKRKNLKIKKHVYSLDSFQSTNQGTWRFQTPLGYEGNLMHQGSCLADGAASQNGKLAIGKNVLVAYVPWEGYNFEDAIVISERLRNQNILTSLHLESYEVEVKNTQYGVEEIIRSVPPDDFHETSKQRKSLQNLDSSGVIRVGTWVEEGYYLVGKRAPNRPPRPTLLEQYKKFYRYLFRKEREKDKEKESPHRNTSFFVPKGVQGFVVDTQILPPKDLEVLALAPKGSLLRVKITLLQRRKIQLGDKMAGRHGNKGIISKILPIEDMPYLPDGTPIDIVLNPLGVPSRMNVGQILEGLLGLAGYFLNESYKISLFDEKFGVEASRSIVYSKLYEASLKTCQPWIFEPHHPGKIKLFDGRTGECFDQPITVGCSYMLKLVHLVDDKIHARATGPYSAVTQQPVRGRSRQGGQRLGEMEVWALQAYGAALTLMELLSLKSDDMIGRRKLITRIYRNKPLEELLKNNNPESFQVITRELQALCFDFTLSNSRFGKKTHYSKEPLHLSSSYSRNRNNK